MEASQAIQALTASNSEERRQAAEACAKDPDIAKPAVVPLCRCCGDADEQVREWSQAALEELGPPAAEELDALLELSNSNEMTAYWAVTLIGRLEADAISAAKPLAKLIDQSATPEEVRNRAIWAIGQIGSADAETKSTLEKASQSDNPRTARLAAKALAKLS